MMNGTPNGIPTGIDWQKAAPLMATGEGRRKVKAAVKAYFDDLRAKGLLTKTTRGGHIQLPQREDIDVRVYGPRQDLSIMDLFRYVDKRQSMNPTHKFISVNGGAVQFGERVPGRKARVLPVKTGTADTLNSVTHDGALGITDDDLRFDDYSVFEQAIQTVPGVYENYIAGLAGTLISALGSGINQTWATDFITTLNNAGTKILDDVGDTYGVDEANVEFGLLFNPASHLTLIQKTMASNYMAPNDNVSGTQVAYNVRPIASRKVPAADNPYLVLPGNDMIDAEWDALGVEQERDAQAGAEAWIWVARRNLGIGNEKQVRRVPTSA